MDLISRRRQAPHPGRNRHDQVAASGSSAMGCVPGSIYIDLHCVTRGHQPAGFRWPTPPAGPARWRRPHGCWPPQDHNVPTIDIDKPIADPVSRTQVETLRRNCAEFGVRLYPMETFEQGIVHVVGSNWADPTGNQPSFLAGDSHTSTHGRFRRAGDGHRHLGGRGTRWPPRHGCCGDFIRWQSC